jgi:hypothetical protein
VSLVGRLERDSIVLRPGGERVPIERRCDGDDGPTAGTVALLGVATGDALRLVVPCGGIRSAPAVALGAVSGKGPTASSGDSMLSAARQAPEGSPRPILVAALLALGALLLGGTSAWYWRRSGAERTDDADPASDEATGLGPVAARLTLVSVPREHGP